MAKEAAKPDYWTKAGKGSLADYDPLKKSQEEFPLVKEGKEKLASWMFENIVSPLASKGHEDLGAGLATAPLAALDFLVPSTPIDAMASMAPLKFPKLMPKHTRPDQMIKHVPQLDLSKFKPGSDEWMEAYKAGSNIRDQIWKRVLDTDPELKSAVDELSKGHQAAQKQRATGFGGAVFHNTEGIPTATYAKTAEVMPHEGTHWMIGKTAELSPEYPKAITNEINRCLEKYRVTGKLADFMTQLGYDSKNHADEFLAWITSLRGHGNEAHKADFKKIFESEEQYRSWMQRAQKAYNDVVKWADELTPEALEKLVKPNG